MLYSNKELLEQDVLETVESQLNEADMAAESDSKRMSHEEVFDSIRKKLNGDVSGQAKYTDFRHKVHTFSATQFCL